MIHPVALATALLLASGEPALQPPPPGAYRVGPGDVIEVLVEGRPDLSRLPTVQTTGTIWLPRVGEVAAAGLTLDEIAERVRSRLVGDDLGEPRVRVRVHEYLSKFVWVQGAVARPGRKPLRGGARLVDALLDAGGFTRDASGEVTITRGTGSTTEGRPPLRLRFGGKDPTPRELEELAIPLASGDVITAVVQRWVTISGPVTTPGRYPLTAGLTVSGLVDAAGGLDRFGSSRVRVRRPGTGAAGPTTIEVDLRAVQSGEAEDVRLEPGDAVEVRTRRL